MVARISPARRRPRLTGRLLAVITALVLGSAVLTACAATSRPSAAGAQDAPAAAANATPPVGVVVTDDVPYAATASPRQTLDVCAPNPNGTVHPAVVLVHGGGWMKGDKSTVASECEWLAQAGFVTFNVDYRLAPAARFPTQPDDVAAAVRFIREPATVARYEIDPSRVGIFGGSAGANLATLVALDHDNHLDALVELSGPMDLTGRVSPRQNPALTVDETSYLGCRTLARCPQARSASPLSHVTAAAPPTFIGQAAVDFVPRQQGDALAAALKRVGVPVTVEQNPGAHHSFAVMTPTMKTDIIAFLHAHLGT
ncbi:alpha/beta hydrolase [Gryllotalpicola reticulitermitis]|uniref:Alpha/beta hydrolase n=1 Tax=Gryllotalpicola reticulitermitis TaxID=1184153 RepID=A0ABV8Q7H3_9MICO